MSKRSKQAKAAKKQKKADKAARAAAFAPSGSGDGLSGSSQFFDAGDVPDAEVIDLPSSAEDTGKTAMTETDPALLEQARDQWNLGDWAALAALGSRRLDQHPDRAKLALLAAVGFAQTGQMLDARVFAARARNWGCDRALLARVLIAGVHNSLGRAAALHRDEPRALAHFEASVATVSPRADAGVLGRARAIHERTRLGQLPEAAKLMGDALAAHTARSGPSSPEVQMLSAQIGLMNHTLGLALQRGQLSSVDRADEATALQRRSTAQLGQDLWVLEQTGQKRGGFFVEFGATDGVLLSNSLLLEQGFGWSGLCIEPNPAFYEKLVRNRHCQLSNACITGKTGETVEFVLADEYGGVIEHIEHDKHAEKRRAFLEAGKVLRLTGVSLHDILIRHNAPRDIDYLSIDTEGSEYEILSHFPWDKWNIRLITVEHNFTPARAQIRSLLTAQGYQVTEQKFDDWYFRPLPA